MSDDSWDEVIKGIKPLKNDRFVEDIKPKEIELKKDKVITVAFDVLKRGKVVIAAARLSKYKEHNNDHQKQIIREFADNGYILELREKVNQEIKKRVKG